MPIKIKDVIRVRAKAEKNHIEGELIAVDLPKEIRADLWMYPSKPEPYLRVTRNGKILKQWPSSEIAKFAIRKYVTTLLGLPDAEVIEALRPLIGDSTVG